MTLALHSTLSAFMASKSSASSLAWALIDRFIDDDADQAKSVKAYGPGCSLSYETKDSVMSLVLSRGKDGPEIARMKFSDSLTADDAVAFFEKFAELAGPPAYDYVIRKLTPPAKAPVPAPESSLG